MKYADLHSTWCRSRRPDIYDRVDSLAEANGIRFACPVCGPDHQLICWSPQAHPEIPPLPGRWSMSGTGVDDLTLTAESSSIQIVDGCGAHFYIRAGNVIMA